MDVDDQLSVLVGRAVSRWSQIELTLAMLYCIACDADEEPASVVAQRVFWSIPAFAAKLKLVDTALKAWLIKDDKHLEEEWRAIKSAISPVQKIRNDIAHASILDVGPDETVLAPALYHKIHFKPAVSGIGTAHSDVTKLRVADLEEAVTDIDQLIDKCSVAFDRFYRAYCERKGKH